MLAGHLGAGLVIGRFERRVNVGVWILAALLLDVLLWLFVLVGLESVTIPADYPDTHRLTFTFPWSHSLTAAAAWSGLAGLAFYLGSRRLGSARRRAAGLIVTAVVSHWLLDALLHHPGLPVAGATSAPLGLGLWRDMPVGLGVETAVLLAGICLFLPGARAPLSDKLWLTVLCLAVLGFTMAGMTIALPPPSATAMATTSLVMILVVAALAWRLGRLPR
jgi:hypothetical protein